MKELPWIVALTGASGICYGRRLLEVLATTCPGLPLEVVISDSAFRVMKDEENLELSPARVSAEELFGTAAPQVRFHNNKNIGAGIASGSYPVRGMVVIPCSMKSLAAIAHGYSDDLIHRAADVTLKEQRPLLIVPRETPLSSIHLENMLKLSRVHGVSIIPAMPGFYHQPKSVAELVDGIVQRVIDLMKVGDAGAFSEISPRWGVSSSGEV